MSTPTPAEGFPEENKGPVWPTDEEQNQPVADEQATSAGGAVEETIEAPQTTEQPAESSFAGLAAQGFSEGEATRLLAVSERAAYSAEARESEAVMNRLRFTRWLIERGYISEFAE